VQQGFGCRAGWRGQAHLGGEPKGQEAAFEGSP